MANSSSVPRTGLIWPQPHKPITRIPVGAAPMVEHLVCVSLPYLQLHCVQVHKLLRLLARPVFLTGSPSALQAVH